MRSLLTIVVALLLATAALSAPLISDNSTLNDTVLTTTATVDAAPWPGETNECNVNYMPGTKLTYLERILMKTCYDHKLIKGELRHFPLSEIIFFPT